MLAGRAADMQCDELALRRASRRRIESVCGDGSVDAPASNVRLFAHDDRQGWVVGGDRHADALCSSFVSRAGGDGDQGHDAVSRVRVLLVAGFRQREFPAYAAEGAENVADGHCLAAPRYFWQDRLAHGRCHSLPSAWIRLAASGRPHVPAAYIARGGRSSRHAASMGSTNVHAASTSSARVKSVGAPLMQSRSKRSYASGVSTRKEDMEAESLATLRRA